MYGRPPDDVIIDEDGTVTEQWSIDLFEFWELLLSNPNAAIQTPDGRRVYARDLLEFEEESPQADIVCPS